MQGREGSAASAFPRNGTWDASAFGGTGTWAFAGAPAAGRFGWLGQGDENVGSKRVLETVQKLCDVIDAQKRVMRRMQDVKGQVQGILGGLGLGGLGGVGAGVEVEAGEVWDSE